MWLSLAVLATANGMVAIKVSRLADDIAALARRQDEAEAQQRLIHWDVTGIGSRTWH
jgi:hypothetical protein